MRKHPNQKAERYRFRVDGDAWAVGTNNGSFKVPSPEGPFDMAVIVSCGGGWDHVSVSFKNRTPTWKEMCAAKDVKGAMRAAALATKCLARSLEAAAAEAREEVDQLQSTI